MNAPTHVLLDRDGTLIEHVHHLHRVEDVALLPGTLAGLSVLRGLGLGLTCVTNQSVVARGLVTESGLEEIHDRLRSLLGAAGVALDGVFACPHRPEDGCRCRKPKPGLVERAQAEHGFDPARCVVIGDGACDVELGRAIGALTVLVRTGHGLATERSSSARPDFVCDDLHAAAEIVRSLVLADAAEELQHA